MTIMAMARAHIAGEHAGEKRDPKCALCPACEACGGKGAVVDNLGRAWPSGIDRTVQCKPCAGTGAQKGGRK